MSTMTRPPRIRPDIPAKQGYGPTTVGRNTYSTWPDLPIPDDPREQRWIRNRLMVFAIASPIARLLSLLFR